MQCSEIQPIFAGSNSGDAQQGRENTDPLPNPWAPASTTSRTGTSSSTTTSTTNASSTSSSTFNTSKSPFSLGGGVFQNIFSKFIILWTDWSKTMHGSIYMMSCRFPGMFNSPSMQSMLQQVQANPQLMSNMMQAPYIQSMMQAMSANPDLANSVGYGFYV